jgi:alpha-L-rhamnosidase
MTGLQLRIALCAATALCTLPAIAQEAPPKASLENEFQNPPQSARPRVWWHWMNGNISKDGIAKDLEWMKRVGIGGLQNFDANLQTPQIVDKRLVYMTPEWKDAFAFATREAERHGLELAIAASPGWSETGGPWVPEADGLKKLVWSETVLPGGKRFKGVLTAPPSDTGPFLTARKQGGIDESMSGEKKIAKWQRYGDIAVLAFPVSVSPSLPTPHVTDGSGLALDVSLLQDADLESAIAFRRGTGGDPIVALDYGRPQKIRSASLYLPGAAVMFLGTTTSARLEFSEDATNWHKISDFAVHPVPTTISFAEVTARYFRVVFGPGTFGLGGMSAPEQGVDLAALAGMDAAMQGAIRIGDLRLSVDARIDRFEAKAGFELEPDYYALSTGLAESTGIDPSKVINLTDKMKPDGSLDWTPPKGGMWRVLRLGHSLLGTTNHPAPPEATGLEVDKFDGPAVRRYIETYLGMYRDAAGAGMVGKKGVRAILTDSIEVGAANWTPKMVEQFKRLRGYDPVPFMPAITGAIVGSREQSDKFLYDYRRTLADLMSSEHYGTVAEVAKAQGLIVYGEALESFRPSLGDDMAMRRHADIPMAAMWTHGRSGGPRPSHVVDLRGAASVAHVYGQNLVAAESMTSAMAPWAHSPKYLKRIMDLEFVNGINRPVVHTSVHQPRDDKFPGLTLFIFGQYFNRHEAWAEMAKPWVDYLARNSYMLQQGRNAADVAYFYGEEAPLTTLKDTGQLNDAPTRYAYDFVNNDALFDALSNDGAELVAKGGARYKSLYLGGSARKMTLATLRRIAALAEGGATIIGAKPEGSPSLNNDAAAYDALIARLWPRGDESAVGDKILGFETAVGQGRVIASKNVEASMEWIKVGPQFHYKGGQADSSIPFVQRTLADGESFFIANQKDRTETIEARFRVKGKVPEIWRAETGRAESVNYHNDGDEIVIPLTLTADESFHIVFRKGQDSAQTSAGGLRVGKASQVTASPMIGAWKVAFQQGRGAPATTTLATLKPLNENADAGIKYFSGIATYTKGFAAPKGWKPGQRLMLDLGEVGELAEVSVNGKPAGAVWHAPYRLDIGALTKSGQNNIEIRVANLWINRLIGDVQPGAQRITWHAGPGYSKDASLRPSGLIGPVVLLRDAPPR